MRIGVIGLGTIATALVEGIADDGPAITVFNRNAENAARLSGRFAGVSVSGNQNVIGNSDMLFLGLTDDIYREVLSDLRFREPDRALTQLYK